MGRPERGSRGRKVAAPAGRLARAQAPTRPNLPLETIWCQALLRRLRARCATPLRLEVTDNIHTMLSFRRRGRTLEVRLHHMFLVAPDPVVDALASYIQGSDPSASGVLDRFIMDHRWLIRRVPPHVRRQRVSIRSQGRHHDLEAILRRLIQEQLRVRETKSPGEPKAERTSRARSSCKVREKNAGSPPSGLTSSFAPIGPIDCAITWGSAPTVTLPRQSIKLGSYSADARLIRIHPALDQRRVPSYFVEWIVFHELLHHLHGIVRHEGKRCVHTPAFCADERRFPDYLRATAWERENLDMLLAWAPPGPPIRSMRRLRAAYTSS